MALTLTLTLAAFRATGASHVEKMDVLIAPVSAGLSHQVSTTITAAAFPTTVTTAAVSPATLTPALASAALPAALAAAAIAIAIASASFTTAVAAAAVAAALTAPGLVTRAEACQMLEQRGFTHRTLARGLDLGYIG